MAQIEYYILMYMLKNKKHLYLLTILRVGTFGKNKLLKEQTRHPFYYTITDWGYMVC